MDFFMWATTFLTIWAAVGPLVGVRYGQEMARRNQRAQWVNDSKKKEFKELLNTLDIAIAAYVKHVHISNPAPDDFWVLGEASNNALRCVSDRLFILPEMKEHNIRNRWIAATEKMDSNSNDIDGLCDDYKSLRIEIIAIATKDIQ